jgi:hypothetical protein
VIAAEEQRRLLLQSAWSQDPQQEHLFHVGAGPVVSSHFRSGAGRLADLAGTIQAGQHPGVVATDLRGARMTMLRDAVASGRCRCFIDSGAFGEFQGRGEPIWSEVLAVYQTVVAGSAYHGQVSVVAPDKVGDPRASADRLRIHAGACRDLIDAGADLIVPFQGGPQAPPAVTWWDDVHQQLGGRPFRIGVPSCAAVVDPEQLASLLVHRPVAGLHLLGMSEAHPKFAQRLQALTAGIARPLTITADANRLAAAVGAGRPITEREREERAAIVHDLGHQGAYLDLHDLDRAKARDLVSTFAAFAGAEGTRLVQASQTGDPAWSDFLCDLPGPLLDRWMETHNDAWFREPFDAVRAAAVAASLRPRGRGADPRSGSSVGRATGSARPRAMPRGHPGFL